MNPSSTACPECAQQPGQPCVLLPQFTPLVDAQGKPFFHAGRFEMAAQISGGPSVELKPELVDQAFTAVMDEMF
jgi:hypothetical protein